MKNGFKILDSDMHLMEPVDLWERYIDAKYKADAPRGLTSDNVRDLRMAHPDGRYWGLPASHNRNSSHHRGHNFKKNQDIYRSHAERGWTAAVQLEAMDIEGIDVAVLYPTRGLQVLSEPAMEPKFAAALARAYNDWLYDFCKTNPFRLLGAGMLSPFDVDEAVAEAKRCATELGFRAVFMRSSTMEGRNWYDDYFEPLWTTLEEYQLPVGFHESSSSAARQTGDFFEPNFMLRRAVAQPMEQMLGLVSLCSGGVLARHPKLRAAFLEANCTWLPWLLWRLDEGWEREGDIWAPDLGVKPSEYFKNQCFVSVEPDEDGVKYVIDYIGTDRLVFSTDYPHGDSKFPHAVETFVDLPISADDKRKILWDNCAEFYRLGA
ncbi:MAG TPA: amidohydrolase family protein [Candidatus Polarisedimenticolaceae bacterium]|nr:amidohydrolase family protein [Candidatus Polarisedimenticolaceae bacterium]